MANNMLTANDDKSRLLDNTLEFLAEAAIDFAELSSDDSIYEAIGRRLKKYLGKCFIIVNSYHPDTQQVQVQSFSGLGKQAEAVVRLLGGHPAGRFFSIDDNAKKDLMSGRLMKVPQGIFSLSPAIPRAVYLALETLLDIGDIYSMGFIRKGRLLGNAAILLPKGQALENEKLVETYVNLASVAIQRHNAQEQLKKAYAEMEFQVKKRTAEVVLESEAHRKSARALRASEEKYRLLVETAGEIILTLDLEGKTTYINKRGVEISGYSVQEVIGKPIFNFISEEYFKSAQELLAKRAAGNAELFLYEIVIIGKDGRRIVLEVSSSLLSQQGSPSGMLLTSRDITARKHSEKALKESQKKYRDLINTMNEGLVEVDEKWDITFTNNRFARMIGLEPEQLTDTRLQDLVSREYKDAAKKQHENCRNGITDVYELELVRKDGNKIFVHCSPNPFYDQQGKYLGGVVVLTDITEQKKAQIALNQSEKRYRFLAEKMADIVWTIDQNFKTTYVSPSVEKVLGFTPEERKRQTLEETVTPESFKKIQTGLLKELEIDAKGNADPDRAVIIEVEYYHKDGSIIWFENTVKAIRDPKGAIVGMYGVSRDISGRKQTEKQRLEMERHVRQAKKAESLGRMAGAIAHHFNNQFSVVLGSLEMALAHPQANESVRHNMTQAFQAARKAAEVSSLMLTYLGQSSGKCEPQDLAEVFSQNLPLLLHTIPKGILLETNLMPCGPVVRANAGQLSQILNHLITNAREALGNNSGNITLTTRTVPVSDIPKSNLFPADWMPTADLFACIEVKDTGCGMDDEDMDKIFDPFFSTKFTGRGLELPVVLGFVKTWGGAIGIESKKDHGSIFRIYLPLVTDEIPRQAEKRTGVHKMGKGGIVLLVEDQDMVRDMVEIMLKRLGFDVLAVSGGFEAVKLFAEKQDYIRCVITDLSMPGMDGWETLAALRKIKPDLPVILSSGYDESHAMGRNDSERPHAFLHKPYSVDDLKNALDRALGDEAQKVE